jgi:hypothetical protein
MNKAVLKVIRELGAEGGRVAAKNMTAAERRARAKKAAAASAKVRSAKVEARSKGTPPR